jgi:hypothetical protein|tara:strand:- start:122 stop:418 length:297 start_codon:yes stop_codon:yes gene_type:complete
MHIGLCEGRHEIKTNEGEALDGFIFGTVENPMDFLSHFTVASAFFSKIPSLHLYVTGLTTLLTATLLAAEKAGVESLILMHFDRETGKYIPQDVSPLL